MVNHYFIDAFDSWELHLKLSRIHRTCLELASTLVERRLLHEMTSDELWRVLILHHLHFTTWDEIRLLKGGSHLWIHHNTLLGLACRHLRKRWGHQHHVLATTSFRSYLGIYRCKSVLILSFWNLLSYSIRLTACLLCHWWHYKMSLAVNEGSYCPIFR